MPVKYEEFNGLYIAELKGEASNRGARVAVSLYVYIYIRHSQFVTPRLRKSHAGASCIIRAGRLRNIHGRFAQHLRLVCALFVDKGQ